ncbi:MAG: MCE family protein, partial [Xanthomonadaceae bacterium]|nr:MCE family protein [Xanthomonadaceae bacterium]
METRAHHVLIGAFTLVVVLAALLFVLWLGKSSVDHAYSYYDVVFNESVTGLSKGGMVQYNGIKVGQVAELKLDPRDPRKVIARIQVEGDTPVKQDTRARLGLLGLTGIAFIQLSGGSPGSPPLRSRDDGHVPVIVADNSELSKLLNSSADIATSANEILQRIETLLSERNVAHISATLSHLDETTSAIAGERTQMQQAIVQLAASSAKLNDALTRVDHLAASTDALVNDQGRATLDSARASLASF